MKRIINILIINLFFILCFSFAYAEKIIMKDGTEYDGNIHHQDENVLYIVQKEELIKLNVADIKEIQKNETLKKQKDSLINNLSNDEHEKEKKSETILQIGYDFYGQYLHKGHKDESISVKGVTFGAKYYHYFMEEFAVGCGVNLQNSRQLENIPGEVYFVPAYISLKLRSVPTQPYKYGYVVGNLGYNFFFPNSVYDNYLENEKAGIFYSAGLGIVYNHILFEVVAAFHKCSARIKSTSYDIDIEYQTYTFSIGYIF